MRYTDLSNFWYGALDAADWIILYERASGSFINRASNAKTVDLLTDYEVDFNANGDVLTLSSGANTCNYTSSAGNTKTEHGIRGKPGSDLVEFDWVGIDW